VCQYRIFPHTSRKPASIRNRVAGKGKLDGVGGETKQEINETKQEMKRSGEFS
jgi:hypothetical protein